MKKLQEFISNRPLAVIGGTLIIGLLLGWLLFGGNESYVNSSESAIVEHDHEVGTTWTCSMHPQIRQGEPGSCPICGMDLIPIAAEGSLDGVDGNAVVLSASALKIAEVETTIIEKRAPFKEVILSGQVKSDERRIHELTAHFPGRIEKLFVNFTGQKVYKGQVLATIFSPELVTAQKELFEAIKYKDSNPRLYLAARNKLKLWLFTTDQIDEIEQSGEVLFYSKILSPGSGTVSKRNIAQGDHVMEGMSMFQIIDLSHVWVEFDAYESDIPWIKMAAVMDISIKSVPGKVFKSKVAFIDPVLNERTRTTIIRGELDNKSATLRPGMFAQASIKSNLSNKKQSVMVPKSAVLWTGKKSVVYVKEEHGESYAFHYREIILGEDTGSHYVVVEGLQPGEAVVTNGAFKIDAAAQLKGNQSMMNPDGGKQSLGGHEGMDMGVENALNENESEIDSYPAVDTQFKTQFSKVVMAYLILKDDLVLSESNKAVTDTETIKQLMEKVNMNLLKGDAHTVWMRLMNNINQQLAQITKNAAIAAQRRAFATLSGDIYHTLKTFEITGLNIYYQYCPMVEGDRGAYWLSLDSEIKNPYFGEAMLTCGETIETIN